MAVYNKCTPFECRKECLDYVRRLKKNHPCYHGDVGDLVRAYANHESDPQQKSDSIAWFSKLDSCDWELWSEGFQRDGTVISTSGASFITSVGLTLIFVMTFFVVSF